MYAIVYLPQSGVINLTRQPHIRQCRELLKPGGLIYALWIVDARDIIEIKYMNSYSHFTKTSYDIDRLCCRHTTKLVQGHHAQH